MYVYVKMQIGWRETGTDEWVVCVYFSMGTGGVVGLVVGSLSVVGFVTQDIKQTI